MNYQEFAPNLIGLIGVSFVLLAYVFLQLNYWKSQDVLFSLSNLVGACCILFSLFFNWNLASATIEVIWILISLYRLLQIGTERFQNRETTPLAKINLREKKENYFVPLTSLEIASFLKELGNQWEVVNGNHLRKTWSFPTYEKSMEFVNQIAEKAEKENHHPVFLIEYKKVTVTIWTHNVNALTQADYVLAAKISQVFS